MANPYTEVSISGYNNSPPPDDGSEVAANQLLWSNHKENLGDPLRTAIESLNTNVNAAFATVDDASNLTRGTLPDARLSFDPTDLAFKSQANTFQNLQTIRRSGGGNEIVLDGIVEGSWSEIRQVSYRDSAITHVMLRPTGARGTESSPAALQDGDSIFALQPRHYDGSSFASSSSNRLEATLRSLSNNDVAWSVNGREIGWRAVPNANQTTPYTVTSSDFGTCVEITSSSGTVTVPSGLGDNGDTVVIINSTSGGITVDADGTTIVLAGVGSAGSTISLGGFGIVTLMRLSASAWFASGAGVTS